MNGIERRKNENPFCVTGGIGAICILQLSFPDLRILLIYNKHAAVAVSRQA